MIQEKNLETIEINHKLNGYTLEDIGDDHLYTGLKTPMKKDAFKLSDEEKNITHGEIVFLSCVTK